MFTFSVYFTSSPTGVIQRLYHHKEDPEELVHVKKYLLSALSGHLQVMHESKSNLNTSFNGLSQMFLIDFYPNVYIAELNITVY